MTDLLKRSAGAPQRDKAPLLAHITTRRTGRFKGLCGKRLIGEDAPDDAPTCVVCEDLAKRRRGGDSW